MYQKRGVWKGLRSLQPLVPDPASTQHRLMSSAQMLYLSSLKADSDEFAIWASAKAMLLNFTLTCTSHMHVRKLSEAEP